MTTDVITRTWHGTVLVATIDRAAKANSLNREVIDALDALAADIEDAAAREVGALVLTGAGERAFSAGADIGELDGIGRAAAYRQMRRGQQVFDRIEALGPEWKPEKSKIVMTSSQGKIIAYVDPSSPTQWRKSPFYERLVKLMQASLPDGILVYVAVGNHYTLFLPDRLEEIGRLGAQDEVILKTLRTPVGRLEYQVEVLRGEA